MYLEIKIKTSKNAHLSEVHLVEVYCVLMWLLHSEVVQPTYVLLLQHLEPLTFG